MNFWVKLPYRSKVALGMALAFLLYMGMTLLVSQGAHDYLRSRNRLAGINRIQITRDALFSALQDAETGQRGYILTGNEKYLTPYETSVRRLPQITRKLERMVANDPFQRSHLATVERLSAAKISELQETIKLRRSQGFQAAVLRVQQGYGRNYMEQIRQEMNLMQAEHAQQLQNQTHETNRTTTYMLNILSVSQIVAFGLLLLMYGMIYRETLQREQAERRLKEVNENLEREVAARTEELHKSNQELEQFAFVASHDLQAPLRKIQVFIEMLHTELDNQPLSESALDYLGRIGKSASRMQDLIVDLLAISRVNRKGAPFQWVNLNELASEAVDELSEMIQTCEGRVELGRMCQLEADPEQMRQVLVNLVSNAMKYHQDGVSPCVKITSEMKSNNWCELVVADNGIGIAPEYQEKVFEIFQRLHGAQYEGSGIGLSIVKRIVERHGGKIQIESQVGQGSRFILQLPVHHVGAKDAELAVH